MDTIIGEIHRTDDYSIFKRLEGNRSVPESRIRKIKSSIEKVGYVLSPILINDNGQVIDGQGRLEALKRLGLPVDYIVAKGIGIKECTALNINQTPWSMKDYIDRYAEDGVFSYMFLQQLLKAFGTQFDFRIILTSITGKVATPTHALKEGDFECTQQQYNHATALLTRLLEYKPIISQVRGNIDEYYSALMFCFDDPDVNNGKLLSKIERYSTKLVPVINIQAALEVIEDIYNYNTKSGNYIYIRTDYRKAMDGKYSWYSTRYGSRYET